MLPLMQIIHLYNVMSNIKVIVSEFGPVKDAEITFAPMLLFTGNSNMGKSYINYLFFFLMRSVTWDMFKDLVTAKFDKMKVGDSELTFKLSENDLRKWLTDKVRPFMANFLGNEELKCDVSFVLGMEKVFVDGLLKVNYNRQKVDLSNEQLFETYTCSVNINEETFNFVAFANDKRTECDQLWFTVSRYFQKHIFGNYLVKSVILPPARGSYVGESYSAKDMIAAQAGMYKMFLNDYDFALHKGTSNAADNDEQFFLARMKALVNGELKTQDNKQYLLMNNGTMIPLTSAASSIKELSPFLFYLKNWSHYNFSFCIEEPEAHLHPSMQKDIADLLAACVNKGMFFQMTTHSDYFLQRINQLILLGTLRKQDEGAFEKLRMKYSLNKRFYLNKEDVACYYFHEDGDNNVKIEKLEINEKGLPLTTFFTVVRDMTNFDDELAIILNADEYRHD